MKNRDRKISEATISLVEKTFAFKDFIEEKRKEYLEIYKEWCEANPGYIMHNAAISEMACKEMLEHCNSIEDLQIWADKHFKQWSEMPSPNGHYVMYTTYLKVMKSLRNKA